MELGGGGGGGGGGRDDEELWPLIKVLVSLCIKIINQIKTPKFIHTHKSGHACTCTCTYMHVQCTTSRILIGT